MARKPPVRRTTQAEPDVKALAAQATRASLAPILNLPGKSIDKATRRFENFTLSRFAKDSTPSNYVPHAHQKAAATGDGHVQAFQRKKIEQHLHRLRTISTTNRGMKVALPADTIKTLLPSFDDKTRTINLDDLMTVIEQRMTGTEFFANGHPTLTRMALRARMEEILGVREAEGKKR